MSMNLHAFRGNEWGSKVARPMQRSKLATF
jgi:hypothetical protein